MIYFHQMKSSLYRHDFLLWIEEQSDLFRSGKLSELDLDNIFEELDHIGKEQKLAFQFLLRNIMFLLLKLHLSPSNNLRPSWVEEITELRDQAQTRIEETPSLEHYAEGLFIKAWPQAMRAAQKSLEAYKENVTLPNEKPYSLVQVLDHDYF